VAWDGSRIITATNTAWGKWPPSAPHWYGVEQLGRLIGANIAHAEDNDTPCPTVLAFIREFRGLSSTKRAKSICDSVGAERRAAVTLIPLVDMMAMSYLSASFTSSNKGMKPSFSMNRTAPNLPLGPYVLTLASENPGCMIMGLPCPLK
jgi:hypothetical protein